MACCPSDRSGKRAPRAKSARLACAFCLRDALYRSIVFSDPHPGSRNSVSSKPRAAVWALPSLAGGRIRVSGTDTRVLKYISDQIGNADHEQLLCFNLNHDRQLIDHLIIAGDVCSIRFRARSVIERAFQVGASALLLAHNHPSGRCFPSANDVRTTRHLRDIAASLDFTLDDHVIVTSAEAYSMRAGGHL